MSIEEKQERVDSLNREGVEKLMAGEPQQALALYECALAQAVGNDELVAQCLINLGDWYRRIPADLRRAWEMFGEARSLNTSMVTKSRLCTVEAMALASDEKRIERLYEAIRYAHAGHNPQASHRAELFALHRLAGIICHSGTKSQKRELLPVLEHNISRLDPDDGEVARLNYSRAMIIAPKKPQEAIALLEAGAERFWTESPLDAGPYLIFAAEIAWTSGDEPKTLELCEKAENFRAVLKRSEVSSAEYLSRLDQLYSELEQQ